MDFARSFLLLIFFIAAMTILRSERDLSMQLPPPVASPVPSLSVVVGVESGGKVVLNPGVGELVISEDPTQRELAVLEKHVAMVRSVAGSVIEMPQRIWCKTHSLLLCDPPPSSKVGRKS